MNTVNKFPEFPRISNIDKCIKSENSNGYFTGGIDQNLFINDVLAIKGKVLENFCYMNYVGKRTEITKYNGQLDRNYIPETTIHYEGTAVESENIGYFNSKINRKYLGDIETTPSMRIDLDLANNIVTYYFHFNYIESTKLERGDETVTIKDGNYYDKEEKGTRKQIIALELNTNDVTDFYNLGNMMGYNMKKYILFKFEEFYGQIKSNEYNLRNKFYVVAPTIYVKSIDFEIKIYDLIVLLLYDAVNPLKDTHRAMMNILTSFENLEKLYRIFYDYPWLVKKIYQYTNGKEDTDEFCKFITALSAIFQQDVPVTELPQIYYGGSYQLNSDVTGGENNTVKIENYGYTSTTSDRIKPPVDAPQYFDQGDVSYEYTLDDVERDKNDPLGAKVYQVTNRVWEQLLEQTTYHPMQLVLLTNVDTGETVTVSAIFVKSLSDRAEWEQITKIAFAVIDIISLFFAFGVIIKGAKGIRLLFALADVAVTTADVVFTDQKARETLARSGPAGAWFAENLSYISAAFSFTHMGFEILQGIGKNAAKTSKGLSELDPKAFPFAKGMKEKVDELLINYKKYLLEQPGFPKFKNGTFEIVNDFPAKKMPELADEGVMLVKGVVEGGRKEEFFLIYKNIVIESAKSVRQLSKRIREIIKKGSKTGYLGKHLGGMAQINPILRNADDFLASAKRLAKLKITAENAFEYLHEALPHFNHKVVDGVIVQIDNINCGNTVKVVSDFLKTGKVSKATPSFFQGFENVAGKFGGGIFQPVANIPRMKQLIQEGEDVIVYAVSKGSLKTSSEGHYFNAIKKNDELIFFDGQNAKKALFSNRDEFSNFINFPPGYKEYAILKIRR